jgi:hypothetical protein
LNGWQETSGCGGCDRVSSRKNAEEGRGAVACGAARQPAPPARAQSLTARRRSPCPRVTLPQYGLPYIFEKEGLDDDDEGNGHGHH